MFNFSKAEKIAVFFLKIEKIASDWGIRFSKMNPGCAFALWKH